MISIDDLLNLFNFVIIELLLSMLDKSIIVFLAGFLQGLGVVVFGFLIYLLYLFSRSGFSRVRILLSGALFTISLFVAVFVVSIILIGAISLAYPYVRILVYLFGFLLVLFGALGFLSETLLSDSLKFIRINPLNSLVRRFGRGGLYVSSAVIGFLGGLASVSCPCSLPLLPAIYSYIVSSEIYSSIYMGLLYSFSATIPSLAIFILLSSEKIFRVVYDYIRLYMNIFRAIVFMALAIIGLVIIIAF